MSARTIRRTHQRDLERAQRRRGRRLTRATVATGAALGAGVMFAPVAQGAPFVVSTGGDAGDGNCDITCTLRDAVDEASADVAADTITFAPAVTGEITLTQGELFINNPLTITGPGAGTLSVSGDRDSDNAVDFAHTGEQGDSRIFRISGPYVPSGELIAVSISGLTIKEGVASSYNNYYATDYYYEEDGGGIYSRLADLTLTGVTLTDNLATEDGGGIRHDGGSLTLIDSTVTDNRGYEDGGGVSASAYSYGDTEPLTTITDTTIANNDAGDDPALFGSSGNPNAGGLELNGNFTASNVTITGNTASTVVGPDVEGYGGGADIQGEGTMSNSLIANNAAGGNGGGVTLERGTILSTTISGNTAGHSGGGAEVKYDGTLRATTVTGNSAPHGGGVYGAGGGRLVNSTISGNQATNGPEDFDGVGGGVFVDSFAGGPLETFGIRNSTIASNSAATDGGGIYSYAYNPSPGDEPGVALKSTIVGNNTAPTSGDDLAQNVDNTASASFSLVENPSSSAIVGDPPGSSLFGVDPELAALANNGGPTRTHALSATSAAIDAGQALGLGFDQAGQSRTVDAAATDAPLSDGTDMGAFEVQDGTATGDDPDTEITDKPKKKVKTKKKKGKKVKFEFTGSDATDAPGELVFECRVDDLPFETCVSPFKIRLKKGKHTFDVFAIDTDGNADGSPADAKVKVKKKKPKKD